MDYEFDCPQYYDFENGFDSSNPEVYFETRRTKCGSPYSTGVSSEESVDSKSPVQSPETSPLSSPQCGHGYNTRMSVKKEQQADKKSPRVFKSVSSKFQSSNAPPAKKVKIISFPQKMFKKSLTTFKRERKMRSSKLSAKKRILRSNLRRYRSTNILTRTVPEPFSFSTDKRVKTEAHEVPEYKHVDFVATLRSNDENQNHLRKGPVRAIPERLLGKRKLENKKTMAEQVISFQHGLSNRVKPTSPPDSKAAKLPRLTVPVMPTLRAACRSRPVHVLSQEEKEKLEAEEMKKYHFKAQPMNPKILVPFVLKERNRVEKPEPIFKVLNTEKRAALRPRSMSLDSPPEFHARPVPKKILEGVTGLAEKVPRKATEPHTPPFVLKKREETWKQYEEAKQKEKEAAAAAAAAAAALQAQVYRAAKLRARTASNSSFQTSYKKAQTTVPAPFSFYSRDQETLAKKEQKIHFLLEEEKKAREFRANPMPSPAVSGLPHRKKISPTKIQPFTLELENLAPNKSYKWQKKMEEEMKQEKEATKFKAQPCTVTHSEPFLPIKSNRPLTEFASFDLSSDSRAAQRNKFDLELKQKEEERLALLAEQEQEKEMLERKRTAKMRAKTVHKANPVPHIQPFQVKHDLIPVTKPISPNFQTDKRLKLKRRHE